MIKRFFPILLVFLILLSSVAFAESDFSLELTAVKNKIKRGEVAVFNLTVHNPNTRTMFYKILLPSDPRWNIQTEPLSDRLSGLEVEGLSQASTILKINPSSTLRGRHALSIEVEAKSEPGNIRQQTILIDIVSEYPPSQYLPALRIDVDMPEEIDPREDNFITVKLTNQNLVTLPDVRIEVKSDLINVVETTSVGPKDSEFGRKKKVIPIRLPETQEPRADLLSVDVFVTQDSKTYQFEVQPISYEVIGYSEITTEEEIDKLPLRTVHTITYTNVGNVHKEQIMRMQTNWFRRLFTFTDPNADTIKDDGIRYIAWQVSLDPMESTVVVASVNYIPLVAGIIIIIIGVLAYFYYRSPVVIKKASTKIETKEGGISDIKMVIHIKNRSPVNVHSLTVIDVVPKMAELVHQFQMGVLHPSKILKHEHKGTVIKWDIDQLDKFEERILSYRIKSKLAVVGQFTLNPTVARFTVKGKKRKTRSNELTIISS
ncbi:hypothetical protein GF351_00550 [Candidatus Woesearchaeota archaeon]|nr:hypothetical protein [Candidatus Woesearchaeota archaeon]